MGCIIIIIILVYNLFSSVYKNWLEGIFPISPTLTLSSGAYMS